MDIEPNDEFDPALEEEIGEIPTHEGGQWNSIIAFLCALVENFGYEDFDWEAVDERLNSCVKTKPLRDEAVTIWTEEDFKYLLRLGWIEKQPGVNIYYISQRGMRRFEQC